MCDILCNYIYIHLGIGVREWFKCIHSHRHAFSQRYVSAPKIHAIIKQRIRLENAPILSALGSKGTYARHTLSLGNIQQSKPLTATKAIRKP